jgi:hypothetical protein
VKRNLFLALAASLLVLGTLALPVTIERPDDLVRVEFGAPVPFVVQYLADLVPMGINDFPYRTRFLSPWEFSADFSWPTFLLDVAIVWACLWVIVGLWRRARQRRHPVTAHNAEPGPPGVT